LRNGRKTQAILIHSKLNRPVPQKHAADPSQNTPQNLNKNPLRPKKSKENLRRNQLSQKQSRIRPKRPVRKNQVYKRPHAKAQRRKGEEETLVPAIGVIIPFVLPGIGILVFLVLTEKDRLKPWAKDLHNKAVEGEMAIWNDPVKASRFGMFSGAIWIFATGIFFVLGFIIGFKFSWPVFIFATAIQLLVQGRMYK